MSGVLQWPKGEILGEEMTGKPVRASAAGLRGFAVEAAAGSGQGAHTTAGEYPMQMGHGAIGATNTRTGALSRSAVTLVGLVGLLVALFILTRRHEFSDGAHYFLRILEGGGFFAFDRQRLFAQYLTQIPVVAAIKLGVTRPAILSALFGAGLYAPYIVSLFLCYRILRDSEPRLMAFPLLAYASASFDSSFTILSEAHVMAAIFWPMFFYIYVRERFSVTDFALLLALCVLSVLTYASTVLLAPLLLVGVARRLPAQIASLRGKLYWGAVALALLAAFAFGLEALILPRDPGNRQGAVAALWYLGDHLPVIYSGLTFLAVAAMASLPGPARTARRLITAALAATALVFVAAALIHPELIRPEEDFRARVLLVFVPAGLGALALVYLLGKVALGDERWRGIYRVIRVLVVFQLLWQANATYQWYGFVQAFQQEIASHHGLLAFEDSILARERVGLQTLRQMTWGWTNPAMSILVARDGEVSSLLLPPAGERFRPLDPARPPDLSRYGIRYGYLH
jgi:hypothetical protein